ncbi:MAG: aspartyl/glutamyl-tRNA amidotransferase subunit A [Candidatus Omnitrophica bacterium CG1_02_44_16]|nr:MAG: aspartyl/glutamyl-tRNA amidotransferase subunit A [Candidatus Omnitrophica bacterium CG1_02_44_16]PIY82108.1 MAG: Asp-tRNA(Asn)/Glu-tRNA(Gln) amidotransferase GatCAB subunit A [Candidatus Omnitrophica bacterium CG_4_10_14_0_8_um_filter_44_12]PIZ83302.1 MAG: Asp-tRNA(Asn)/Glu-tRNA(Gln) amidotransferase GatCAB subunit A [Candidatus Omnitrophica bacterium CG_4_10_14_0_2_um_filter_44_9]
MKLNFLTAHELQGLLAAKKIEPVQILADIEERCRIVEPKIRAYARAPFFRKISSESRLQGELSGIPAVIKDNICSDGDLTECCSRILEGFRPPYDATVVEKLKGNGSFIMAKANMDEFAFGSSCETSCFYPTRNPWNTDHVPGGSSGGAAASVAADEAIFSLGSDTGGSIRQPAALCGVVGLKPTYGRVSRYGLIAFASSLDQIGPLTKDVRDNALLLKIISGHDEKDSTSADMPVPDYPALLEKDVRGMRVAIPREYFVEGMDPEIRQSLTEAKNKLGSLGVSFGEVSLPHTEYAVAVYYIIATAEASSNLARFDGVQYGLRNSEKTNSGQPPLISMYKETRGRGFGAEAKRRITLGTYVLSSGYYDAYYLRASKVRALIKDDFDKVFKEFDLILTPTSPTAAFKLGEKTNDPLNMYLSDIYTISANLAGIPAISLPCGLTKKGLPIGMQVLGKPFGEEDIFRLAYQYEQNTAWHKEKPKL